MDLDFYQRKENEKANEISDQQRKEAPFFLWQQVFCSCLRPQQPKESASQIIRITTIGTNKKPQNTRNLYQNIQYLNKNTNLDIYAGNESVQNWEEIRSIFKDFKQKPCRSREVVNLNNLKIGYLHKRILILIKYQRVGCNQKPARPAG